jgi:hypothetical protein
MPAAAGAASGGVMLIDCESCEVRDIACGGCVVSALLGGRDHGHEIDEGERRALDVLADVGLVPPLRHTPTGPNRRVS